MYLYSLIVKSIREFYQMFENKHCFYEIMKVIFAFEFILRLK